VANTLQTLSDGDITRRALAIFHNKLKFIKTTDRQYDKKFPGEGVKNGGSILIRDPNQFTVRSGATMNVNDISESSQTMTVATQRGVDMPSFTTLEKTMSVQDFEERYLEPAMSRLAAECESIYMTNSYRDVYNLTGTPATTPASLLAVRKAGARLSQNLAPDDGRSFIADSDSMINVLDALNTYFHKSSDIEKSFSEGNLGHAAGFDWYESNMVPNHTNGTRDDTTPVTDTSAGTFVNGATTLVTTGFDNADTLKKGDIFTIGDTTDGVMAINLETKAEYGYLQQFVVTADKTLDSTDTIAISPTIYTSGAKQNMSLKGTAGSMALINTTGGGSGASSLIKPQNLAYHRDAFAIAFADLHMEPGERMTQEVIEGVPMRIWHGSDIINDKFFTRIDVVFGTKTLRPEWADRVRG